MTLQQSAAVWPRFRRMKRLELLVYASVCSFSLPRIFQSETWQTLLLFMSIFIYYCDTGLIVGRQFISVGYANLFMLCAQVMHWGCNTPSLEIEKLLWSRTRQCLKLQQNFMATFEWRSAATTQHVIFLSMYHWFLNFTIWICQTWSIFDGNLFEKSKKRSLASLGRMKKGCDTSFNGQYIFYSFFSSSFFYPSLWIKTTQTN